MLLQGQVGQITATDGAQNTVRVGRTGEFIGTQSHARYYEQTSRGNIFSLMQRASFTGIAAGNLLGAAANAVTQFAIWNPNGSGVNLSLMRVTVGVVSATTMPAGPPFHGVFLYGNPTNNTTFDPAGVSGGGQAAYNNLANGKLPIARYINTASQTGTISVSVATTITGGTAPIALRPMNMTFTAAGFASAAGTSMTELVEGDIVIPPGYGWLPLWNTAGSATLPSYSVTWEEVPI